MGSTELYLAYSKSCAGEGEEPGTQTAFSLMLQNKGFDTYTSNGRKRRRGLGLCAGDDIARDPQ